MKRNVLDFLVPISALAVCIGVSGCQSHPGRSVHLYSGILNAPHGTYQIHITNSFNSESEKQSYLSKGNVLMSYIQHISPNHEFMIPASPEAVYEVVISPIGNGATLGDRIKDVRLKAGANVFQLTTPVFD